MRYLSLLSAVALSLATILTAHADPAVHRDPSSGRVAQVSDVSGEIGLSGVAGRTPVASADEFLRLHGELFGAVSGGGALRNPASETDSAGISHVKYHQFIHGFPVYGSQLIVHLNPDGKRVGGGKIAQSAPALPAATIAANEAEAAASSRWARLSCQ